MLWLRFSLSLKPINLTLQIIEVNTGIFPVLDLLINVLFVITLERLFENLTGVSSQ